MRSATARSTSAATAPRCRPGPHAHVPDPQGGGRGDHADERAPARAEEGPPPTRSRRARRPRTPRRSTRRSRARRARAPTRRREPPHRRRPLDRRDDPGGHGRGPRDPSTTTPAHVHACGSVNRPFADHDDDREGEQDVGDDRGQVARPHPQRDRGEHGRRDDRRHRDRRLAAHRRPSAGPRKRSKASTVLSMARAWGTSPVEASALWRDHRGRPAARAASARWPVASRVGVAGPAPRIARPSRSPAPSRGWPLVGVHELPRVIDVPEPTTWPSPCSTVARAWRRRCAGEGRGEELGVQHGSPVTTRADAGRPAASRPRRRRRRRRQRGPVLPRVAHVTSTAPSLLRSRWVARRAVRGVGLGGLAVLVEGEPRPLTAANASRSIRSPPAGIRAGSTTQRIGRQGPRRPGAGRAGSSARVRPARGDRDTGSTRMERASAAGGGRRRLRASTALVTGAGSTAGTAGSAVGGSS